MFNVHILCAIKHILGEYNLGAPKNLYCYICFIAIAILDFSLLLHVGIVLNLIA